MNRAQPKTFSLLVFYRGLHCPACKTYLQALDRRVAEFHELGTEPVALSMDTQERAKKAKDSWEIEHLPIGYELEEDSARRWGLFISDAISDAEPRRFCEPGLFLVRASGDLHYVAINSMPFGRPQVDDVVGAVRFILEEDYPARGIVSAN